jgi:hypothetical protein
MRAVNGERVRLCCMLSIVSPRGYGWRRGGFSHRPQTKCPCLVAPRVCNAPINLNLPVQKDPIWRVIKTVLMLSKLGGEAPNNATCKATQGFPMRACDSGVVLLQVGLPKRHFMIGRGLMCRSPQTPASRSIHKLQVSTTDTGVALRLECNAMPSVFPHSVGVTQCTQNLVS